MDLRPTEAKLLERVEALFDEVIPDRGVGLSVYEDLIAKEVTP